MKKKKQEYSTICCKQILTPAVTCDLFWSPDPTQTDDPVTYDPVHIIRLFNGSSDIHGGQYDITDIITDGNQVILATQQYPSWLEMRRH